ncbi:class I SAM-dependent RNA methyltransferase [Arthrobacter sp. zg-Y1110]|uniref:class I SAM-dependent RNA methyltransferase n=1 Tax=Arthrobacter sp. zg-Y1110 TaxID=2886932 RepID=UPI001D145314|nr:TRAM domain-containing protein [Arthrobacter sp. zg-Y1110]MCC3290797.1 class I SAM-dependent RNA methyltransferase [Arthrobacter sp. zg-Y1110]UWX86213.1 class I SAM-dependent RNA methyltransferase [Arthrobacter sp. zg-Y1110]
MSIELTIGAPAHGGHFVARHEGRVVFVRHGLPGERVRVRLTESGEDAKFWRADVVEVLEAAEGRREHFWKDADALRAAARGKLPVGGAEFGHIDLPVQRRLKAEVFAEQLRRLGGTDLVPEVEPALEESADGLGWRTRVSFSVAPSGRLAMHAHRSDELIPVEEMPLASAAINALRLWETDFTGIDRVEVAAPAVGGQPLVLLIPAAGTHPRIPARIAGNLPDGVSVAAWDPESHELTRLKGRTWVQETVLGHDYRVTGAGFWQIHRSAPQTLAAAVLEGLQVQSGESVADLYAGAGLFTAPLAAAAGESGRVLSVEGSPGASRDARKNLFAAPQVQISQGRVDKMLREAGDLDVVLLDPPRVGAGKAVVQQIDAAAPRVVGYVSCDPASFSRDLGYFRAAGWEMDSLRVFDLYPHTHHMESFAVLRKR